MEVIKTLLAHECSVDFQDRHSNTPLHVACKDSNMPIVVALCEASCSLDISNKVSMHSGIPVGPASGFGPSVCV
jgi:death-associated protein kinase